MDDLDAVRLNVEETEHVLARVTRYRDDRVGHLEGGALDPGRDVVAATQLLALPGTQRLQGVDGDHERDTVGQPCKHPGEVRVPGVTVHDVGVDRVGHKADVTAQRRPQALQLRLGSTDVMRRLVGAHAPASLVRGLPGEAAHLDVDELAQLAGQVVDVDAGASVHMRRKFVRQDQRPHRRQAYLPSRVRDSLRRAPRVSDRFAPTDR